MDGFSVNPEKLLQKASVHLLNRVKEFEDLQSQMEVFKNYDTSKIPASLEEAELHRNCTTMGKRITDTETQREFCPCCLSTKKQVLSRLTSYTKVTNMGTTIPIYYQFKRYMALFYFIMIGFSIYPIYQMAELRYEYQNSNNGGKMSYFSLEFIFDLTTNFVKLPNGNIIDATKNIMVNDLLLNWAIFFFSVWFSIQQKRAMKRLEANMDVSAKDFTLMIGNVDIEDTEEKIKAFINAQMRKKGLIEPRIVKMNKATVDCKLKMIDIEIEEVESHLKKVSEFLESMRTKFDQNQVGAGEQRIKDLERELKSLQKKRVRAEKKLRNRNRENEKNCVVFVTFASLVERDAVFFARPKKRFWLFRLCKPDTEYKILLAPFPEEIKWNKIGYSIKQRVWSALKAQVMIMTLFPLFASIAYWLSKWTAQLGDEKTHDFIRQNLYVGVLTLVTLIFSVLCEELLEYLHHYYKVISRWKKQVMRVINLIILGIFDTYIGVAVQAYVQSHSKQSTMETLGELTFLLLMGIVVFLPFLFSHNLLHCFLTTKGQQIRKKLNRNREFTCPEHFMTQLELNHAFEKEEFPVVDYYQNLVHNAFLLVVMHTYCRISIIFGLVNLVITDIIERFNNKYKYKMPPRSAKYLSTKMRSHTCFGLMRAITLIRINRYFIRQRHYTSLTVKNNLLKRYFWFDIPLFILMFIRYSYFLDKIFGCYGPKEVFTQEMMVENEERTQDGKGSGLESSQYEFEVAPGEELLRRNVITKHFNEVESLFTKDYDRENPLTCAQAQKDWLEKNKKALTVRTSNLNRKMFVKSNKGNDEK